MLVSRYSDWYKVLWDRVNNRVTTHVKLRNGLLVLGNEDSLVLDLVKEIFVENVYNPKYLQIRKGYTVIDIGANIGVFSLYASMQKASNIYVVEPLKSNADLIKINYRANNFKTPVIIQKALSNIQGTQKFYLGNFDTHGFLSNNVTSKTFSKHIYVKTITLENILLENKLNKIDFLKIDCEGAEGNILLSPSKETWNKIDRVAIEYHDSISIMSHTEIAKRLRNLGFKVRTNIVSQDLGYIYAFR